ncbi:hypothetical protein [Salaquimonas pukyongi]|uniref:hypothetical protein n=1 Tax=Salaquimonas pukyongi TaxID=2712698 RepID=UPI00096B720A|nr:hypothetical protein [Salaquimonas pukyongi]
MKDLLANARWMDGAVWTVLMIALWCAYEFGYRGVAADALTILQIVVVWALAGAGFAILSGWFAQRAKQKKD